jgi:hypothetical protein
MCMLEAQCDFSSAFGNGGSTPGLEQCLQASSCQQKAGLPAGGLPGGGSSDNGSGFPFPFGN